MEDLKVMLNTCASHSGLQTDIKWLQKGVSVGFAILLSAIVYFNQSLQKSIISTNQSLTELRMSMSTKGTYSSPMYTLYDSETEDE